VTALIGFCNVLAVINLFRLRKAALTFFVASLALNLALTVWHIASKGFLAAVGGLLPVVIGMTLLLAIILYTAHLSKKQVLQ